MVTTVASATEMKNNFGKYLGLVMAGEEVVVTKNGREVGRLIPNSTTISYLTDSLVGILREDETGVEADARGEGLREKYGPLD